VGTGKTSWAIDFINQLPVEQKILYITPFLDECERVQKSCIQKNLRQPDVRIGQGKKRNHFLELIKNKENIASTHKLFSAVDNEIIEALQNTNYILILDEAFQVLNEFDMWRELPSDTLNTTKTIRTKTNLEALLAKKFISVDKNYKVEWIEKEYHIDKYSELKELADRDLLYFVRNSLLLWSFPYKIFMQGIFEEIFILTYLFNYQMQKYYYDYFGIKYLSYHIEYIDKKYEMIKTVDKNYEDDWKDEIRPLITILDSPKINNIGAPYLDAKNSIRYTALSKNWYLRNQDKIPRIKKNIINFFVNIVGSKSSERMWTCFSIDKPLFKSSKLSINDKRCWVALNSRSTNNFLHKSALAYPINVYINPFYDAFFATKNIKIDNDGFAISTLVQWMWRSRIRNNEPIEIYLPSSRMRKLLRNFLGLPNTEELLYDRYTKESYAV